MLRRSTARIHPTLVAGLLGAALFLGECATTSRGDVIFLKDGTVLLGKIRREGELVVENGQGEVIAKGFVYVDNGPRRLYFSSAQVDKVDDTFVPQGAHVARPWKGGKIILPPNTRALNNLLEQGAGTEWDDEWNRKITVRVENQGKVTLRQHLTAMNPFYAKVDCYKGRKWNAYYLIEEMGAGKVRGLLGSHPELAIRPCMPADDRLARHVKIFRFYLDAGWHDLALDRARLMRKQFPDRITEIEKEEKEVWKQIAKLELANLKLAHKNGQHQRTGQLIAKFTKRAATPKMINDLQLIQLDLDQQKKQVERANAYLTSHLMEMDPAPIKQIYAEAVELIQKEIGNDNVGRLETYLKQSLQAERRAKLKLKPAHPPDELLALAVTGWLQGNAAAETNYQTVERLWAGRAFLLEYLDSPVAANRDALLKKYLGSKVRVAVDEMAQMIALTPPPKAEAKFKNNVVKVVTNPVTYHVQLPPEYHPRRAYPVLFVLHDSGGTALDMLKRWGTLAAKHGYLLVAPEWSIGAFAQDYTFTAKEHAKVLDALEDCRRKFHVDDDRIFMFGLGQGGTMALDVGQSHPDYFAGVIPMSPTIHFVTMQYCTNSQYLPTYVVGGDLAGKPNLDIRNLFKRWIPHGYVSMYVQYKGRGREWFGAELPFIFEWMDKKKRYFPLTQLGRAGSAPLGDELKTFRPTDNSFYWITTSNVAPGNRNGDPQWSVRRHPASIYGFAQLDENKITIRSKGLLQLTIWIARTGQIDLTKKVRVALGIQEAFQGMVKPSLKVMLERFYERRDRKQLFVARLDFGK